MRLKPVPVVLVVAVVVLAAGCGGSSKSTSGSPAISTSASTGAAATTSKSTTTAAAPKFATTKNCAQLMALGAKMAQALQGTAGGAGSTIADEAKALQAMAAAVPSEIRGDFQTFASAFNEFAQTWAKVGVKAGKVPTPAQLAQMEMAAKVFSSAKLQAAEQHLSAWSQKNCGVKTTTTG